MQNLNKFNVSYAVLHQPLFVPGTVGTIGPTLTADATGKTKDLKMRYENGLFIVEVKGITAVLPATSTFFMVPAKE